jgi:hypothetical protein
MSDKEKNTKVLMEADFSFHMGKIKLCDNITQEKALELVRVLSARKQDKQSCTNDIIFSYSTQHWLHNDIKLKQPTTSELSIDIRLKKMKCCNKRKAKNSRDESAHCAKNIQCGLCKDKNVRGTIGVLLFPDLYKKR